MAMKFGLFNGADSRSEVRSADGRPLPKGDADHGSSTFYRSFSVRKRLSTSSGRMT
jgi:hypothetical protein